jgi:hypothetical protein
MSAIPCSFCKIVLFVILIASHSPICQWLRIFYSIMCRMRGQRAVAVVPRGVRVPEEGAALLHPLHGRALQLHRPPRPPHPSVPRLHGGESEREMDCTES